MIDDSTGIPRCVWPKCGAVILDWPQLHLCNAHVRIVVEQAGPRLRTQEVFYFPHQGNDKPKATRESKPPQQGMVYFLRSGAYIKIGWTGNLKRRMRTHSPDSVLLATMPGTREDEAHLHRRFAVHRTHGREWYAMVPALTDHIAAVVREHGEPDPVTFAAKPVQVPRPHAQKHGKPKGYGPRHVA